MGKILLGPRFLFYELGDYLVDLTDDSKYGTLVHLGVESIGVVERFKNRRSRLFCILSEYYWRDYKSVKLFMCPSTSVLWSVHVNTVRRANWSFVVLRDQAILKFHNRDSVVKKRTITINPTSEIALCVIDQFTGDSKEERVRNVFKTSRYAPQITETEDGACLYIQ